MNENHKRLAVLKARLNQRIRPPVIIARLIRGEYEYRGKRYSMDEFNHFVDQANPAAVIINDIPKKEDKK
jgi:hypothetical protein